MASKGRGAVVLCLARCGETNWDQEHRIVGATDLPLSSAGRASVSAAVEHLQTGRIGTVYHARNDGAAETAHLLAAAVGARTKAVTELAEPSLGVLAGLSEQDLADRYAKRHRQWQTDPLSLNPPQGEPMIDAQARLFTAVARILKRTRAEEVGIVLGTLGVGLLRCWLSDLPASAMWNQLQNRPSIERYAVGPILTKELDREAQLVRAGA